MKKQDLLSIWITFFVGVVAGGYLYLTGLAGLVDRFVTPDAEKVSEFTIVADVYGGCRSTCPSFQVTSGGSYRYLYTPAAGAEQVLRQGSLPSSLTRQLRQALTAQALAREAAVIQPAVCNSYTDGIDVRYKITLDGVAYTLDSCGTDIDPDGKVWTTLQSVWEYYERTGNN